jgi:hypothetical protein
MSQSESRPIGRPSVAVAVEELRNLAAASCGLESARAVKLALRNAVIAVEQELGAAERSAGVFQRTPWMEPRLIHAMERVEADVTEVLLLLWRSRADLVGASPDLEEIVHRLDRLVGRMLALLHESLRPVGTSG